MINYIQKEKNDNLYTPFSAVYPILKYLPRQKLKIWECCDYGDSKITKLLKHKGHEVISTDIIHDFNFLSDKPEFDFDMIITNPPYSLKDKFIEKCFEYKKPFALLLPITSLEGKHRSELFSKNGISVIILDERINFTHKKNVWFNTSWFCKGIIPDNTIKFENVKRNIALNSKRKEILLSF